MTVKTVKTICFDCHSRCGVIVESDNGKLVGIKGDKDHPFSHGYICPKGLAAAEIIYHPDRIKYPLKRIGKKGEGKFERISWEEALNTISKKLLEYREQFGAESVVFGQGTTRGMPPWIGPFLSQFGSPNYYAPVNYSGGPVIYGSVLTCGYTMFPPDFANSKCIVLWATNPEQSWHGLFMHDIRQGLKSGAKLIVVDPRGVKIAQKADHWLPVRPGTDVALVLSFINIIIKNDLYDKEFVEKWTYGFEQLREHVSRYTAEYCSEITWIPADDIERAALTYGKSKAACIMPGIAGACQSVNSLDLSRSLTILAAITGNLDVPGGNMNYITPLGARACYGSDFSVSKYLSPEQAQKSLARIPYPLLGGGLIPPEVVWKAILEKKPYPVKAVGIFADNALCAFGDSKYIKSAFEVLDFLFAVDYFHTPTTAMADIILPAAHWTERDDIEDLSMKNYVFCQPKALEPISECRSEKQILVDLAKKMGLNDYWKTVEESLNYRLEPIGITWGEFKKMGKYSVPVEYKKHEKTGFPTGIGKVAIYADFLKQIGGSPLPEYREPPESPVSTPDLWKEFPLVLTTGGRNIAFYHSAHRNIPSLRKRAPDPLLQIHPQTAAELGVKDGEWVYLASPRGRVEIKIKFFEHLHPKVVHAFHGYWYGVENGWGRLNINILTAHEPTDPVMASVPIKGLLCRVEKMNS